MAELSKIFLHETDKRYTSPEFKGEIEQICKARAAAIKSLLADAAPDVIYSVHQGMLKAGHVQDDLKAYQKVEAQVMKEYTANLKKGGTMCIERVLTPVRGGKIAATTKRVFVPWIDDMAKQDADNIINLINQRVKEGANPRQIAAEIRESLKGSGHDAMNVARTEASKLRNDVNVAFMVETGYKYVQYVTTGDSLVRPEHAERNGRIYKIEDTIGLLGEYRCRCTLVPADYEVDNGAKVEKSTTIILDKSQVGL